MKLVMSINGEKLYIQCKHIFENITLQLRIGVQPHQCGHHAVSGRLGAWETIANSAGAVCVSACVE